MIKQKPKYCKNPECNNQLYRTTQKYCSRNCATIMGETPKITSRSKIKPVSDKQSQLLTQYSKDKKEFIKGKICPVYPKLPVTDIHHTKGRQGYADEWARINNVPLLLDQRFWLAVSRKGHVKIELNPEWAKKMGYSVPRTT